MDVTKLLNNESKKINKNNDKFLREYHNYSNICSTIIVSLIGLIPLFLLLMVTNKYGIGYILIIFTISPIVRIFLFGIPVLSIIGIIYSIKGFIIRGEKNKANYK